MISVVIPTVAGRESLLDRTVAAYRDTADCEIIIVRNRRTCGEGWNDGAAKASRDYLHLAADDILPKQGWVGAAISAALQGVLPCPRLVRPDGTVESFGSMGGGMLLGDHDGAIGCVSSPFPFIARRLWGAIGPSLAIHYYADDYLAARARDADLRPMAWPGFEFTHLEGTVGRDRTAQRAGSDRDIYLQAITRGAK